MRNREVRNLSFPRNFVFHRSADRIAKWEGMDRPGSEFQTPQVNVLMGNHYAALDPHFLDITKTETETEIQPDALENDLGREAMSPVAWCAGGVHLHSASWAWQT